MKKTRSYYFIFSNKWFNRLPRHILFWISRALFIASADALGCLDEVCPFSVILHHYLVHVKEAFTISGPQDAAYCYFVVYYLWPTFMEKKRYRLFSIYLVLSTIVNILGITAMNAFYFHADLVPHFDLFSYLYLMTQRVLGGGAPAFCIIFLGIKTFKTWYRQQEEKQMLIIANADAEIQLLTAQVQPHFLFNTLNNIYLFTLDRSSTAGELVLGLSDMLKYMVNECDGKQVALEKEIDTVRNYIKLEKVKYGTRLKINEVPEYHDPEKRIAPLLMFPFVENSFKHGASKVLTQPWIKLLIEVKGDELFFAISNSQPLIEKDRTDKRGMGLNNVKKRLDLLYPGAYSLSITDDPGVFSVHLRVPLRPGIITSEKTPSLN